MVRAKKKPIAAEERQFSLILALVASPQGLTREQLLSSVYGYAQDYERGIKNAALERKFERDKDQLRSLGFPIEVIDSPSEPGNNQLARYRISKDVLQIPRELRFSPDELLLMRAAALTWRDTSLSERSRQAVIKLESFATEVDTRQLGAVPQVNLADSITRVIHLAIHNKNRVHFDYRRAGDENARTREVSPLRLFRADSRWHLIGYDHQRKELRTFLITRIEGEVKTSAKPFYDGPESAQQAELELAELREKQLATVQVRRGSQAHMRLATRAKNIFDADAQSLKIELTTLDYHELASELLSFTSDVEVLDPPSLKEAISAKLEIIAKLHGAEL